MFAALILEGQVRAPPTDLHLLLQSPGWQLTHKATHKPTHHLPTRLCLLPASSPSSGVNPSTLPGKPNPLHTAALSCLSPTPHPRSLTRLYPPASPGLHLCLCPACPLYSPLLHRPCCLLAPWHGSAVPHVPGWPSGGSCQQVYRKQGWSSCP